MLVLTRRQNEEVIIRTESGETIRVVVTRTGNQPRLGFEAPQSVRIIRAEKDTPNNLEEY